MCVWCVWVWGTVELVGTVELSYSKSTANLLQFLGGVKGSIHTYPNSLLLSEKERKKRLFVLTKHPI